jgi:hypothetical protein
MVKKYCIIVTLFFLVYAFLLTCLGSWITCEIKIAYLTIKLINVQIEIKENHKVENQRLQVKKNSHGTEPPTYLVKGATEREERGLSATGDRSSGSGTSDLDGCWPLRQRLLDQNHGKVISLFLVVKKSVTHGNLKSLCDCAF